LDNLSHFEEQLASPSRRVRHQALNRLARVKSAGARRLLADVLHHDDDRDIRSSAARLLAAYAPTDVLDDLLKALQTDRHAEVRRVCAELLGELAQPQAAVGLASALHDRSKLVRRAAVGSLSQLDDMTAVPELVGVLLGDADSYVRWDAAKALAALSAYDAIPALIEALTADENSYVRYAAATALGKMGDSDVVDPLSTALLRDDNSYVRYAAARVLGSFLERTVDPGLVRSLLLGLDDTNHHVWHVVAESLWASGETVIPVVFASLLDPSTRLRNVAFKALLWLSTEYDDAELVGFVDDDRTTWGWWN
jgi:HEAT repeat protein